MMNKKGVAPMVLGLIVMGLVVFIGVTIIQDQSENIVSIAERFLENDFSFLLIEELDEETLQESKVPPPLLIYAEGLAAQAFSNQYFTTQGAGRVVFLDPLDVPEKTYPDYEGFAITFAESTLYQYPGIIVSIYDDELEGVQTLLTPADTPFLRYKELCVLPKDENDPSIRSALTYHIAGPEKTSDLLASEIIEEGHKDIITLFLEDEEWGVVSSPLVHTIFKYEENANTARGIPVYIYDNTICFLGISDDVDESVVISSTRVTDTTIFEYQGNGFLYEPTLEKIQDEDLAYTGEST